MFASVRRALGLFLQPALAGLALRAALLTLLLFLLGLAAAEITIAQLPVIGSPIVNRALALLAPVLFAFLLGLLGAPVAALFGALFLDGLAARIEARDYPEARPHRAAFLPGLGAGLRLTAAVLGADIALLPLDAGLPGLGEILSLVVNGWLLGREYFALVALRHMPMAEADALRRANRGTILAAGLMVSLLSVVPLLDLAAPLFGTTLMVHLFHRIVRERS